MKTRPPVNRLADSNVATLLEPMGAYPDDVSLESTKDASASSPPPYIPVPSWNDYYDWPPPGGLRHLIFHADSNGFASAFKRVGRRVLVNPVRFWEIVDEQG